MALLTDRLVGLLICYVLFYLPSGLLKSYLAPFLAARGLGAAEIGAIIGIAFAVKLFASPILTIMSDLTRRHWVASIAMTACALVGVVLLDCFKGARSLGASVCLLMISRNYFQSLIESAAGGTRDVCSNILYGQIRFVGSLSVAAGTLLLGLGTLGSVPSESSFFWMIAVSTAAFCPVYLWLSQSTIVNISKYSTRGLMPNKNEFSWGTVWRLLPILAAATLTIGAQGSVYAIGSVWLSTHGFSDVTVLVLWTIGYAVEAVTFRYVDSIQKSFGAFMIPTVAICFLLRSGLLCYTSSSLGMAAAFALQGITFAVPHSMFVVGIRAIVGPHYAATGQSLYFACAHGLGIAAISTFCGVAVDRLGNIVWMLPGGVGIVGCVMWQAGLTYRK